MTAGPRTESYEWAGGREPMLRFGPEDGPVVILALPLFEEANRTRAFGVTILRALAERGIGGVLPELPGQGESERETARLDLDDLRSAFASAADSAGFPVYGVAIRSGTLIDTAADVAGRWHFAPMLGEALARELLRTGRAADPQRSDLDPVDERSGPIEIAGNLIAPTLLADLPASRPARARIVRLCSDPADAALKVDGEPLWRRTQPTNNSALAELLAADIADWIARCGG